MQPEAQCTAGEGWNAWKDVACAVFSMYPAHAYTNAGGCRVPAGWMRRVRTAVQLSNQCIGVQARPGHTLGFMGGPE
jgi:hypothetical protein